LLRHPRDTKLRSKLRVLRDPTSDLHSQATSSRKGRGIACELSWAVAAWIGMDSLGVS